MGLIVMVVEDESYLLNEDSTVIDKTINEILREFPKDCLVEFRKPNKKDLEPNSYKNKMK